MRPTPFFLGAVVFATAALLFPGVLRAEDEDPAPEAPAEEAPEITWVDGWTAGAAAAEESGNLLFVYVGRQNPT